MASQKKGYMDQVNPAHYQKGEGIETIDYILSVTKDLEGDEAVCVSNVIKYISRYQEKGAAQVDVEKAKWYLEKLLEILIKKSSKKKTSNPVINHGRGLQ